VAHLLAAEASAVVLLEVALLLEIALEAQMNERSVPLYEDQEASAAVGSRCQGASALERFLSGLQIQSCLRATLGLWAKSWLVDGNGIP
jgi:hypothetical protein